MTEMANGRLATLADVGEKELIRRLVRPLFNPAELPWGVGDDCALVSLPPGHSLLASTDRVPADLVSFKAGVLDYGGLGSYLVRLNLSDIAACGGTPIGLLLNLGLPRSLPLRSFEDLIQGVQAEASRHGCAVLGGDLSDSVELSISATALGSVNAAKALSRRNSVVGDSIFITRPAGLTPAAFGYLANRALLDGILSVEEIAGLLRQFTHTQPMIALGQRLAESGICTASMDNTDGLSQALTEIADAAGVALHVDADALTLAPPVLRVAKALGLAAVELAMSAGADFSLVGTLQGPWSTEAARARLGNEITVIGRAEPGSGVHLRTPEGTQTIRAAGWNYYA